MSRGLVDVAIVGAGAAGVAAARRLTATRPDLSVQVLEAAARPGGRAFTRTLPNGVPVDLGCGWLHGARTNEWTRVAGELGLSVDRTPAPWDSDDRDFGISRQEHVEAQQARDGFFERLDSFDAAQPDRPMSDFLEPGNRWNGMLDAVGTFINGADLASASAADYARYEPGPGPDWRVREGYGQLVATAAAGLPIAFETAVTAIDHRDSSVWLETSRGVVQARAVIVTVSTDVLASGAIRFDPPLPDKLQAASALPLGLANKMYLMASEPEALTLEGHLLGSPHRRDTGAYHLRAFGNPVVECYFGGALALDIERGGEAAAFVFALDELAQHLGNSIRDRLSLGALSAWAANPLARGSYSYARPGASDLRMVLAAPVDGRLFFAGEACSRHRFSTAHGAYETGVAAADGIGAHLRGT